MKKVAWSVMVLLFVSAVATSAFAAGCGRGPGYGPCPQGGFQRSTGLDLTAEQLQKIKQIRETVWREVRPLQKQTFAKRDEIRKLWLEPNPDQAKIMAAQQEMQGLRDQIEDKTTAFYLEASKVLTPEQKDKIQYLNGRYLMQWHGSKAGFGIRQGSGPIQGFGPTHQFRPMRGFGFGAPGQAGCFGCPDF